MFEIIFVSIVPNFKWAVESKQFTTNPNAQFLESSLAQLEITSLGFWAHGLAQ